MTMRYLSLCSGIEAASAAWKPLGWQAVAFAEIEPFPCAVLERHYPDVPNLGDISQIDGRQFHGSVELVVAGTPCQDFSIAGKRAGMAGERSGLAREFVRLVREINPQWLVWENVPGVFSTNGGRDFGSFIRTLDDSGYSCAWRVLDAQFFGVPQRRRRVFIVGYFGDWRPAAAVLFERESVCRNFAQSKKAGKSGAGCLKGGTGKRGWKNGAECNFIPQIKSHWEGGPHPCLNQSAKGSGGIGMSDQELFSQKGSGLVSAVSIRTAQTSANGQKAQVAQPEMNITILLHTRQKLRQQQENLTAFQLCEFADYCQSNVNDFRAFQTTTPIFNFAANQLPTAQDTRHWETPCVSM